MTQLHGRWRAAEAGARLRRAFPVPGFDDSEWQDVQVPGHWQEEAAFARSNGPLLYRHRFEHAGPGPGQRAWLVLDGVFYQSDVWLDGSYLGDTEGYFFPSSFDVTRLLASASDHIVGVEVACNPPSDRSAKTALTGVFGDWDCIDNDFNPGGIWAPVHIDLTGPARLGPVQATCRQASASRAVIEVVVVISSSETLVGTVKVELRGLDGQLAASLVQPQPLAIGANRVSWRLEVPEPQLWWPVGLGGQPLYDLEVSVGTDAGPSDRRTLRTGLRTVQMRDFVWRVNGERLFLKGANLAPTKRALAAASADEVEADVAVAAASGLNLLRVHGHIARPELYAAADRMGVLLWQDMPLQWRYKKVRPEAVRQAQAAVNLLGHHPSIAVWCGHNEPFSVARAHTGELTAGVAARYLAAQAVPSGNKSFLDRAVRKALQRADPSRPVVAHSGVLPHPAWGTDSHLYFGWYHGKRRGLAQLARAWPAAARFVSELGAQSVPFSAEFMAPERWPDLDWEHLQEHHCLQKAVFDRRVPPDQYPSFEAWRDATQAYQAELVKQQVETLRLLKYHPTGGFAVFCLNDAQPAVSWSLLDHQRVPKTALATLAAACADVLVVADWPAPRYRSEERFSVYVHAVNDRRHRLEGAKLRAKLSWPGGAHTWLFGGTAPADSCVKVARLQVELPSGVELGYRAGRGPAAWPLELDLELSWEGGAARNSYRSLVVP